MKNDALSITRIKAVYNALGDLRDKVVFVGGAVVSLYAQREVQEPRPTDDIDIIVEVLNYKEQAALDERLRQIGFTNDKESGIACRYQIEGVIVDVMPTTDRSFGFESRWYESGFHQSENYSIDDKHNIRILSAPYYLATKLEAFRDRGQGDGRTSRDFEDIVFILENRPTIWNEIISADDELKEYLLHQMKQLLSEEYISEWLFCHTERDSPGAVERILQSMANLF